MHAAVTIRWSFYRFKNARMEMEDQHKTGRFPSAPAAHFAYLRVGTAVTPANSRLGAKSHTNRARASALNQVSDLRGAFHGVRFPSPAPRFVRTLSSRHQAASKPATNVQCLGLSNSSTNAPTSGPRIRTSRVPFCSTTISGFDTTLAPAALTRSKSASSPST